MANGESPVKIPGIFVAGGFGISNTAILIGALGLAAWAAMSHMNHMKKMDMSDATSMNRVMDDVYSYAAYPAQVEVNRDRIRAAIERARSSFQIARDSFKKKVQDLVAARRAGQITNAQFNSQLRTAISDFHATIRTRWQEIHSELGIATVDAHAVNVMPTVN